MIRKLVLDEDGILYYHPYGKNGPTVPITVSKEILAIVKSIDVEVAEERAATKKKTRQKLDN